MRLSIPASRACFLVLPLLLQTSAQNRPSSFNTLDAAANTPVSATAATSIPGITGTGTGLKGSYFSNTGLTGNVALTRTDPAINFQWAGTGPGGGLPADEFSVRWTGQIQAPVSGAYTFYTRSDDGVRLWVNKQLLINHWTDHGSYFDQAVPVNLVAGQMYDIQLEYYEDQGSSVMQLYWSHPEQVTPQIIPTTQLYAGNITLQPAPAPAARVWLSDLPWISAVNGDGPPQRDGSNGGGSATDAKPIMIGGRRYSSGIGTHARSEIVYALDDRYDLFRAVIGIDDEVGDKGAVTFEVWLDGRRAYQSPVMRGNMPGLAIAVPVENARQMSLVVTSATSSTADDHADWAEARFEGVERVKYLSDLNWSSATNGVGTVAKDRASGVNGARISLRGQQYRKGLGTNAVSEIKYLLSRKYELFSAVIGIDDNAPGVGSAIFEVWTDSTKVFTSPVMRRGDAVRHVSIPVTTTNELKLRVLDGGDGNTNDLGDWADAKLLPIGSDFAPPTAPTGVDATPGNAKVTLEWNPAPLATSYTIYRSVAPGAETQVASGITANTWVNTGLTNGTKYYYRVKSVNPNGVSPYSNEDSATPTLVSEPPPAPRNLDAKAGDGSVKLTWSGSSAATSYNIYRGTTAGGQAATPVAVNVKATEYVNTGLTNGTTYFYKVKAVNVSGMSAFSNEDSARPMITAPLAPQDLDATAGNASVKLTWKAGERAASYNIYRGTASNAQASTPIATGITALTFTDNGLTNGTTYYYKVKSVNASGMSSFSNQDSAKPMAPIPLPGAPSGLNATAGDGSVRLTWTAATGAVTYNVYRGTATGAQATAPIATGITGTTFNNTGLANGVTYFFYVAAVNPTGIGPKSNEASARPAPPIAAPSNLTATPGDAQITLSWTASANAASYNVYRGTAAGGQASTPIATGIAGTTFTNTGLTNGTRYFYKVAAVNGPSTSPLSNEASATPAVAVVAPVLSTATAGNARVTLTWTAVNGAVSYQVFRGTATNAQSNTPVATGVNGLTFTNTGLTNGTPYFYKVAAVNANNVLSPLSNELNATPIAPPVAPSGLTATAADRQITLNWTATPGAATYNVYVGSTTNGQSNTPVATALAAPTFVHTGLVNGNNYFYKVTAVNAGGESPRSAEVNSSPLGAPPAVDPATLAAFRLLRQSSWGPKPGDVDRVKQIGRTAYLQEQFNAPSSVYPDALYDQSIEMTQEQFMQNGMTGADQLRQRVAWALHKIWVVSAVEVDSPRAIVNYHRIFLRDAFGNYRQLMTDMTLNPAMGRYLNMLNNRSRAITGAAPNENYARELLQLFTLGLTRLNQDGTPMLDGQGRAIPTYTEDDVKELARVFTGWTFGDGNPNTIPNNLAGENYTVPMEPVARFHDADAKTVLGTNFPPGQTAVQDLNQALDLIFNHPNLGPFVSRQLIQMLVTSNPSPAYISAIAGVFNNNGSGVRGDLRAVVQAILEHPEAGLGTPSAGKLMEPALFVLSQVRALNATVTDHPFLTDYSEEMGQKVMYPGSVFSYFSPGYRIRGLGIGGPEFQGLTSVTTLTRANFTARLISGGFGADVTFDLAQFTSRANDPAALADYCSLLFMGGQMSVDQRNEIINAVRRSNANQLTERVRTALYLTLNSAQYQVDR